MIYERMVDGVLIRYDGETGQLWRKSSRFPDWKETGLTLHKCRRRFVYLTAFIEPRRIMVHRLAWFVVKGEWPTLQIDHKDRNGLNNAWNNLREVVPAVNKHNSGIRADNKSGIKGVCYVTRDARWSVELKIGDTKHRKRFKTKQEAIAYRRQLEIQHAALMQLPTIGGQ